MGRIRTNALVAGVPLAALVAAVPAAASTPPTEPVVTGDAEASVPADWVELVDDTNTITVSVPPEWTDVDTAAREDVDTRAEIPSIEASTDRQAFVETFSAPGVWFGALPFNANPQVLADKFGLTSGCANEQTVPYDDGVFVGVHVVNSECGTPDGTPEFHVVAANPPNQEFTAVLQIQITGPDEQDVLDGILNSFNMTADVVATPQSSVPGEIASATLAAATTSSTATTSTAATSTATASASTTSASTTAASTATTTSASSSAPATTTAPDGSNAPESSATGSTPIVPVVGAFPQPTGEVPADWVPLTDDSETIEISVPPTWTEVRTSNANGQPWISATTDDDLFIPDGPDTFSVPGVIYNALEFDSDTVAVLGGYAANYAELCKDAGVQTYDDGRFAGHIQTFTGCGGTSTTLHQLAVNPPDRSYTAVLLIQLTGGANDPATLNGLLLSYDAATP